MPHLLVSVRSAQEAEAALAGGAHLIDVKEPTRGSLGRAEDAAIADVVRTVAQRRAVSAALGEWHEGGPLPAVAGLAFVKWGLSKLHARDWCRELADAARNLIDTDPACRLVAVAYADWRRAGAPVPAAVAQFAVQVGAGAFLLDTWCKDDAKTLLDWLTLPEIDQLARHCRAGGVPVALAGSLGPQEIGILIPIEPNWFAVRGAVCRAGRRTAKIDTAQVTRLVALVSRP